MPCLQSLWIVSIISDLTVQWHILLNLTHVARHLSLNVGRFFLFSMKMKMQMNYHTHCSHQDEFWT